MMEQLFTDAARQLLADLATPQKVRAIEAGQPHADLWQAIDEAGFADALVPESAGGAGLGLSDVFGVVELCGEFALPVPLAETMVARGLLALAGHPPVAGSLVLSDGVRQADGSVLCRLVPSGRVSGQVLAQVDAQWYVLPVAKAHATPGAFCLDATLCWPADVAGQAEPFSLPGTDRHTVRRLTAMVAAALLSGALRCVFQRTLNYANERIQFGRPIGKFQAIQHQLAVMSEHVFAARMAARIGCSGEALTPDPLRVAVAKARTSQAALAVAELSHSIHGAIGFTEEYDLQLFTRRLHLWRQTAGTESYWHQVAGNAVIAGHAGLTLDLLRQATDPSTQDL
jgi:acyl-CoA dehydrogenase